MRQMQSVKERGKMGKLYSPHQQVWRRTLEENYVHKKKKGIDVTEVMSMCGFHSSDIDRLDIFRVHIRDVDYVPDMDTTGRMEDIDKCNAPILPVATKQKKGYPLPRRDAKRANLPPLPPKNTLNTL